LFFDKFKISSIFSVYFLLHQTIYYYIINSSILKGVYLMNNDNVIVFLAEGFEEVEALTVVDFLRRGNISAKTMSISAEKIVNGAHNIKVEADMVFDKNTALSSKMIVLPGGGVGTENLKKHQEVNEIIEYFNKNNKMISAICAAPSVLGVKGILEGKTAVCYPGFEPQLKGALIGKNNVEVCKNIVTSKGPGTAAEFALKLVQILKGNETYESVKIGLLL